jgi:hypothetical protein
MMHGQQNIKFYSNINSAPWSFAHFTKAFGRSLRSYWVKQLPFFGKVTSLAEMGITAFGVRLLTVGSPILIFWRQGTVSEEFF